MPERIPRDVQQSAEDLVERLNRKHARGPGQYVTPRFRGLHMYLYRSIEGELCPICRLKYVGSLDQWDFAIYKYSTGRYDPDEHWFPGAEYLDGTIEGAIKAGMSAYP